MTVKKVNGTGRNDVLRGENGADWIDGGAGDDQLSGNGGADMLFGGKGRDTLDGGAGADYLDAGEGDDLLVYVAAENKGSYDAYNGWTGSDTLRLVLTAAEWDREEVRQDVHRFLAYLPEYNEPDGWKDDPLFAFKSLGLAVVGVNKLEVVVDGKKIDATDKALKLADDKVALSEDDAASALVNLLANDQALDGVRSVKIAQPKNGKVELVRTDFTGASPVAEVRFTPKKGAYDHLAEGQTATEVFTYTVTDKDGDVKTASVQVTVTGTNDAPVLGAARTIATNEAVGTLTGKIKAKDADAGAVITYSWEYDGRFSPFSIDEEGNWEYETDHWWDNYLEGDMREGDSRTHVITVTATDEHGATSSTTLTFTVAGRNDLPDAEDESIGVFEDHGNYPPSEGVTEADGKLAYQGTLRVDDDDSTGPFTAEVVEAPANAFGKLSFVGGNEYGLIVWRVEVDKAKLTALGEEEILEQVYKIRVGDGDGGYVVKELTIRFVGDDNDPVIIVGPDSLAGYVDQTDGVLTAVANIFWSDRDADDEHVIELEALSDDGVGELGLDVIPGYKAQIQLRVTEAEVEALRYDQVKQQYRLTITDRAGHSASEVQTFTLRNDQFRYGGDGGDLVQGDLYERNLLVGGEGGDKIQGGYKADLLFGDAGPALPDLQTNGFSGEAWAGGSGNNDELDGGVGADELTGGAGADRFVLRAGQSNGDLITDFDAAAGDRIVFYDWGAGATLKHLGGGKWEVGAADRSVVEVVTLTGVTELAADAYAFRETPPTWSIGTAGDEVISPDYSNRNVIVGGGGRDQIYGGSHADDIYGDQGPALPAGEQNKLNAYERWYADPERDDIIDGGGGADRMTGGAGADTFVFYTSGGDGDVVTDFDGAAGDRLEFRYWGEGATFTQVDADTWRVSSADGAYQALINFANGAVITPDHYVFL
ncbi:VCBS domain-containing protein [Sphingomonas lenta]|uniref:Cadherin domain-containing protein n=1 Tax=Sphingomonas lenta TaxID=1141887 RepID=A0A2A2SG36_9SPHN|nr:VCBS domain-containing protein [Sphingomonas lenta]PAX08217.1 hypothetical protein CKY28_11655 [Sphingomonas lenta]